MSSTYKGVKKLSTKYNLSLSDKEFHCKGSFNNKKPNSHPNAKDLEAAKEFAQEVIK
jgi:uncharacterized Zn-finger protein